MFWWILWYPPHTPPSAHSTPTHPLNLTLWPSMLTCSIRDCHQIKNSSAMRGLQKIESQLYWTWWADQACNAKQKSIPIILSQYTMAHLFNYTVDLWSSILRTAEFLYLSRASAAAFQREERGSHPKCNLRLTPNQTTSGMRQMLKKAATLS